MNAERVFGRTSFGTQEILQKSGRLTQSERLVLIVLGDQIRFDVLVAKLPSLSGERIDRALLRLVELDLAYEVMMPVAVSARVQTAIPDSALRAFLAQTDNDPVTTMATAEQVEGAARRDARNVVADQALSAPVSVAGGADSQREVAIPLGKLFPESRSEIDRIEGERLRLEAAALREQRDRARAQIRVLEDQLARTEKGKSTVPENRGSAILGEHRPSQRVVYPREMTSTAGRLILLIGGVAALVVAATLLIYAIR